MTRGLTFLLVEDRFELVRGHPVVVLMMLQLLLRLLVAVVVEKLKSEISWPVLEKIYILNRPFQASFFIYFRLFNTVDSKQMPGISFENNWIQTVDLWCRN